MRFEKIEDITKVIAEQEMPSVIQWNRLDPRPRSTDNFDKAMKAEVRDALWMLTKQWQMGEFEGDDAGSPVFAKIHMESERINKYKPANNPVQHYNENELPLETLVEQMPLQFRSGNVNIMLDIRLVMGRYWLKLINHLKSEIKEIYKENYSLKISSFANTDSLNKLENAKLNSDINIKILHKIFKNSIDGYELYKNIDLENNIHSYSEFLPDTDLELLEELNKIEIKFIRWYERFIQQPDNNNSAWNPEQLEYQFACGAKNNYTEKTFEASEYYHGHLDWYNLDSREQNLADPESTPLNEQDENNLQIEYPKTFAPSPINFKGMPNKRWWAFEDAQINFADLKPNRQDHHKLLLIEFGLQYGNDWFLFPFELKSGTVNRVKGLTVTNSFGEVFWIKSANELNADWQMFTHSNFNEKNSYSNDLVIPPTLLHSIEGKPVEKIHFLFDEMANMAWGIEKVAPSVYGNGIDADELRVKLTEYLKDKYDKNAENNQESKKSALKFKLMNTVPENWIPFVKVSMSQYQRARVSRLLLNLENELKVVEPRTAFLRQNMDTSDADNGNKSYFIYDQEITRAGMILKKTFQRTRWYNGKVCTWLGIRKTIGRGEGSSGLRFDYLDQKQS